MKGQDVCFKCGGRTPTALAAAKRRLAEKKIWKSLADVEVEEVRSPLEALVRIASNANAFMEFMEARLAELNEWRFTDDKGAEQLRSEVALYERAMDRAQKFMLDWARYGLDEQMVRVSTAHARLFAKVLLDSLKELGLSEEDLDRAREIIARKLDELG